MKHLKNITAILLAGLTLLSSTQAFAQQKAVEALDRNKDTQVSNYKVTNQHISKNSIKAGDLYDQYTDPNKVKTEPVSNKRNSQYEILYNGK